MKNKNYFWIGYSDLLTSLFFVMLVLFALATTYLNVRLAATEEMLSVYQEVESSLDRLKSSEIFKYDKEYKRYELDFFIRYEDDCDDIKPEDLIYYHNTKYKLEYMAKELEIIIDSLNELKKNNPRFKNVSYLMVVTGYASITSDNVDYNYKLSYRRAYNLYKYWKNELNVDFDSKKYHGLLEFQIAGMGFGGIGRQPFIMGGNPDNQRFLINIIPKIGEVSE